MKTKTLYVIVFVLAIIVVLTLIYTRSKISELNPPIPEGVRVEVEQPEAITQFTEPVFFHKQAVTIIKPAQKREAAVLKLDKTENIKNAQNPSLVASKASALGGEVDSQDVEEAAGVTRLGKYPTKEEVKDMNSKGIVMY
jgi:hypothetical protein